MDVTGAHTEQGVGIASTKAIKTGIFTVYSDKLGCNAMQFHQDFTSSRKEVWRVRMEGMNAKSAKWGWSNNHFVIFPGWESPMFFVHLRFEPPSFWGILSNLTTPIHNTFPHDKNWGLILNDPLRLSDTKRIAGNSDNQVGSQAFLFLVISISEDVSVEGSLVSVSMKERLPSSCGWGIRKICLV